MTAEISQTRGVWFEVKNFRRGATMDGWEISVVPSGRIAFSARNQPLRSWLISSCPYRDDSTPSKDLKTTQVAAYTAVEKSHFEGAQFRCDIAAKAF